MEQLTSMPSENVHGYQMFCLYFQVQKVWMKPNLMYLHSPLKVGYIQDEKHHENKLKGKRLSSKWERYQQILVPRL